MTASSEVDPADLVIYGGGGHGKCVIDLVRAMGTYRVVGVIDDHLRAGEMVSGVRVLGGRNTLSRLRDEGIGLAANGVGGIGDIDARATVTQRLAAEGLSCPALLHPSAVIEPSFVPTPGLQVFAHAYVGADVAIGDASILNTGVIVSHDSRLGACVNISPGAMLAGGVKVGPLALIGMGVTVNVNVSIGERARVGNSAVVKAGVPDRGVVRAGAIWPPPRFEPATGEARDAACP